MSIEKLWTDFCNKNDDSKAIESDLNQRRSFYPGQFGVTDDQVQMYSNAEAMMPWNYYVKADHADTLIVA